MWVSVSRSLAQPPSACPRQAPLCRFSLKAQQPHQFIGTRARVGSIDAVERFHEPRGARQCGWMWLIRKARISLTRTRSSQVTAFIDLVQLRAIDTRVAGDPRGERRRAANLAATAGPVLAADSERLRRCTRSHRDRTSGRNNRQSARARFPPPAPSDGATRTRGSRPAESTNAFS